MSVGSVNSDGYGLGRNFSASVRYDTAICNLRKKNLPPPANICISRLNLQHYLWKDVLGYNIHPDIPIHDKEDFRIADIGTGTGYLSRLLGWSRHCKKDRWIKSHSIWLIDVSRQLSAACLDGFDISTKQFPPKNWLPANVSLESLDMFSSIPEELIGKYDVVHVRLFLCVVQDDDPRPLLKIILKMLSKYISAFITHWELTYFTLLFFANHSDVDILL